MNIDEFTEVCCFSHQSNMCFVLCYVTDNNNVAIKTESA